jgi:speckle-type POZ protein
MASSATSGIAKMIMHYEWILENVEQEPMTIQSKMILFRGERIFRVGLKNNVESPVLFFTAIDLNKMGMRVEEVSYGIKESGTGPETMMQMTDQNIGNEDDISDDGNLQLFTIHLDTMVNGNCTFVFRICIEGSVPGYSYRLSDRLAKDQLWDAASKNNNGVDVEIVVRGKTFPAHKSILAARSPIFAAEFTKEQQGNDQPLQIQIDGVDPSTVERFLYFIYTGESMGTLANEELLKLADEYQLITLTRLCQTALKKLGIMQLKKVMDIILTNETETSAPFATRYL